VKAATYCRVSTEEQVENGTSLETQREQASSYVKARGWSLVATFEDAGISGAKDEGGRAGLRDLMNVARSGEIEVVVVTKVDRFSRSMPTFVKAVAELDHLGVKFVSVTEGFDSTTLTGQLLRNILASFADFEHGRINVREQGFWGGGRVPFGYQAIPDGSHKRLVLDPYNAETVRMAAALLVDHGCSTYEAAERLNALARPPAKASRWNHMLLRHMLRREHLEPEILSEERFIQVQHALDSTCVSRRARDQVYPLSLRLYGRCGAPYHGVFRRDISNRFYSCNNKKWENREQRCDDQAIRADDIEYVVWEQVCDLLAKPERLVALAEEYLGLRGAQIEVERDEAEVTAKKVRELDEAIQNVLVTSAKAGLSAEDIDGAVRKLTEERDVLKRHAAMVESWRVESSRQSDRMRRLWELAEKAHARLPNMSAEEQKQVLDLLDVRVTILEHQKRTPGHRVLAPAKVRIEGLVTDQVLAGVSDPARYIDNPSSR
jgi:DNA invertase Pin-like site-specific DNA recombinase